MAKTEKKSHHAHKLCRLLTKLAIANEIGPEACWMLTVIAHTEDAIWYSGPVTFWNPDLRVICGLRSEGRLARARARAVDAGWLIYVKGAKERPPKYRTQIPDRYKHLPDMAVGDQATSGEECSPKMVENALRMRKESVENPLRIRDPSFPVPVPVPVPKKRANRTSVSYSDAFELFWKTYPPRRRQGKKAAAKAYEIAIDQACEPGPTVAEAVDWLQAACERFAVSPLGKSQFCPGPTPWLNQGRWDDAPESWQDLDDKPEQKGFI